MTTDLTVRDYRDTRELTVLTNEQLQFIASTEFVPPGLRGNLPAILACVATGRALGIADMTALRSIHIIDGKATFSAELMVMLARQRGHSIQGDVADGVARVVGRRADNGDTMTVEWTMAMAERAGLASKQNWRKYPESMLWARAVSQLCRELFADCFAGATYTTEELEGSAPTDIGAEPAGDPSPDIPASASLLADDAAATGAEGISGESAPPSPADNIHAAAEALEPAEPGEAPWDEAPPQVKYINAKQRTRLFTIASKAGVPEDTVREIVVAHTGQESTKLIPAGATYDAVIDAIEAAAGDTP